MPKVKESVWNRLHKYVKEFPDYKTDGKILFCKLCNIAVSAEKIFTVKQHLIGSKHIELKERNLAKKPVQQFFGEFSGGSKDSQFAEDLCGAFVAADIPLYKMRNKKILSFLEKYTEHKIPSETTLRTNYVKSLYKTSIDNIKSCINNRFLWLSIDETTDVANRYVANVIIGVLDPDEEVAKQKFLLNTAQLDKVNHTTIARLFDDSVRMLGEDFNKDLILLFISDAAPYMMKAAHAIQTFYPKITHLTCLVHGLHRVCEQIRGLHAEVDRLVANVKKVFLKAPSRVEIFKDLEPGLPLPPQPITTRWGTWLEAVNYYANYYERIVKVFDALDAEDAASIKISQDILRDSTVKADLIFIASNYGFLEATITKLETSGLPLAAQIKIVTDAMDAINAVHGNTGDIIKKKLASVIDKNLGFPIMKNISASLTGVSVQNEVTEKYTIGEMLAFKFAPITSVDVERSFSMYKSVLRANRQSFLFQNLSEMFVIYCNNNLN